MWLDDFIKQNQDAFNSEEPPKGHFKRFEKRLNRSTQRKPGRKRKLQTIVNIAAALGFVAGVAASWMFFTYRHNAQCVLSPEANKIKQHYTLILNNKTRDIEQLLCRFDEDVCKEIMGDVKTVTQNSENFSHSFCNGSDNGIAVMVDFYNLQIQTLQNISSVLEIQIQLRPINDNNKTLL
ncbi:MAG: hypothetical protein LBR10_06255 [Prevotellaceae bacterium]|jgi:arginine/ornithine N-succinyltransferase beta subunit|nr:hypothetical protein [Prevotellaceae bacterium]